MTLEEFLVTSCFFLALPGPSLASKSDGSPGKAVSPRHSGIPAVVFASGYYGEHIVYIGDGGNEAVRLYGARDIGFKFTVISLACFHLWTWGGTYCVFERGFEENHFTEKYRPITEAEAARLLGKKVSELTTPFWYSFPPGVLLVMVAFVGGLVSALVRRIRTARSPSDSIGQPPR